MEYSFNSDLLTNIEFAAMRLIEPTNATNEVKRHQASLMLNDLAYHKAKAGIMQPISNFYQMMDKRTLASIHYAETITTVLRIFVILFGVLLSSRTPSMIGIISPVDIRCR